MAKPMGCCENQVPSENIQYNANMNSQLIHIHDRKTDVNESISIKL